MTSHDLSRTEDLATRFDVLARGMIQGSIQRQDIARDGLLGYYRQTLEQAQNNSKNHRPEAAP
jgi:heme exporter protein A